MDTISTWGRLQCLILSLSILCITGCATTRRQQRRLEKEHNLTKTEIQCHIPKWMKEPLPYKSDGIEAIGVASLSVVPEVARTRAENDLYNKLARAIDTHVTARIKDMVEDHPVFEDLKLSHSEVFYQKISDQITKQHLRGAFVSEVWTDKEGLFGAPGMVYAYGWILKPQAEAMGIKDAADTLRKRILRMKLSEQAEKKADRLIGEMYEKAKELEREAEEKLKRLLEGGE